MTTSELKKLRAAVGEAVRRGIEYADWEAECVRRLTNGSSDHLDKIVAINMCSRMWRDACEEEGIKL